MTSEKKISAKERDMYLQLFIRFVDEGKTPPRYLLEYMAMGARQALANATPWPTKQGNKGVYQKMDRRYRSVLAYALDLQGVNRARIARLIGEETISDDTFRDDVKMGKAMVPLIIRFEYKDEVSEETPAPYNDGVEYRQHLETAISHPGLNVSERKAIKTMAERYDSMKEQEG